MKARILMAIYSLQLHHPSDNVFPMPQSRNRAFDSRSHQIFSATAFRAAHARIFRVSLVKSFLCAHLQE
jgi:hypothetical protein